MTGTINLGDEWEITADETVDDLVIRHKPTDNSFALGADGTFTPLPELAITSVDTVPDKAARLSASAEEGDIVIQTDVSKTFVLTTNDPTVDSNWVEIQIDVLNTIDGQQITPSQVGTSSNRTDVVADSIEAGTIGSNSDRPDLIADDVAPQSIADDYLYAGEFSGSSPDSRLNSCLTAASEGSVIYLEAADYTQDRTISKRALRLVGAGSGKVGTAIEASITLTGDRTSIMHVSLQSSADIQGEIIFDGGSFARHLAMDIVFGEIIINSGTERSMTALTRSTTITDNGSNNTVVGNGV